MMNSNDRAAISPQYIGQITESQPPARPAMNSATTSAGRFCSSAQPMENKAHASRAVNEQTAIDHLRPNLLDKSPAVGELAIAPTI